MKKIVRWSGLRILRDWKTRILLILFLVFFSSFSILYRQQALTFPELEVAEQYQDQHVIYELIPPEHFQGEVGEEVQYIIGSNSVALGTNAYILKQRDQNNLENIDLLPNYVENGQNIVRNYLTLYELTDFKSYDLLVEEYLPPLEEVEQQARFYEAMVAGEHEIEWNSFSAAQILKVELELLAGILLFILIAFLASDHFSKEQEKHWSITFGLPVPWKTQWRTRSLILHSLFWVVTGAGILLAYVIGRMFDTAGSLSYPVGLYFEYGVDYIPLWQYIILVILLTLLLSYLIFLVTTGLSWMTNNVYLTIIFVIGLFLLPQFWQMFTPFSSWQPSLYFNLMDVMSGTMAKNTGLAEIVWWKTPIVYIGSIVALEVIFNYVFSRIPTPHSGLQRRAKA